MPRYSNVSTKDDQSNPPAPLSPASIHEGPPIQPAEPSPQRETENPSSTRRKSKKLTKKPPPGRELRPERQSFKGPTDIELNISAADNTDINTNWPLSNTPPHQPQQQTYTHTSYNEPHDPNNWDHLRYSLPVSSYSYNYSLTTPGVDNFGDEASGGIAEIAGIAMGVADTTAHNSGIEAMRYNTPGYDARDAPTYGEDAPLASAAEPLMVDTQARNSPPQSNRLMSPARSEKRLSMHSATNRSSLMPLNEDAASLGVASPTPSRTPSVSYMSETYSEPPNHRYSRNLDPSLITFDRFDPDSIEDDGDYGLHYPAQSRSKRTSMLSFHSNRGSTLSLSHSQDGRGGLTPPPRSSRASTDQGAYESPSEQGADLPPTTAYTGLENYDEEKQAWEKKEVRSNKRKMWILALIVFILVVGGGVGGIIGEYYVKK